MQDYITKFCWPLMVMLFVGLVYFIYTDHRAASISESSMTTAASVSNDGSSDSHGRGIPYAVAVALVHYATMNITPQQTKEEIMVTANIFSRRGPSNFLVYGLGFDSPLWHTLNHGGRTVFLEEDDSWLSEMAKAHPYLEAYHMNYTTVLSEADHLLAYARENKEICSPAIDVSESECKLAIKTFPEQIRGIKWDVIMIDAPTGYHPGAPGRMGAIFSSAVMAMRPSQKERCRTTDVLLHDVDRSAERDFSREFLCARNLVESVGKLWHFEVTAQEQPKDFCTGLIPTKV